MPLDAKRKTQNAPHSIVPKLLDWFATSARDLPWRRTHDPYAIWVSEIMLQQTQVKTVIPYWERWMRELPTIQSAAKASPATLHKLWEGLGYYTRVRNLQKAAQQIIERHNGKFPEKFEDVLALTGIGRYTAGAICSIAFNQPTPILDGNVIRVLTRIFGIDKNPRDKETNAQLWQLAEQLVKTASRQNPDPDTNNLTTPLPLLGERAGVRASVPPKQNNCSHLNQSLMELGALICTPRSPNCLLCPVQKLCVAFRENRQEELPALEKRIAATNRHFIALVTEHDGKFLVRQRPAGIVNAHLWEFPNIEINGAKLSAAEAFQNVFGTKPPTIEPLCVLKHSITRYRITLEAHRVRLKKRVKVEAGVWRSPEELHELAFSSAHKKLASMAVNRILPGR